MQFSEYNRNSETRQSYTKIEQENGNNESKNLFVEQTVASSVGNYILTHGKERAKHALNIYSHIDYLRPYFDVEPNNVMNRLIYSLVPAHQNALSTELYGPLMIIFSLSAILIYQMKIANHSIEDGTLIGSAFILCFTYWIGSSFFFSSMSFILNSSMTLFNYLNIIGYSLFSHCLVLLFGTFIHTAHDHLIFYLLWFVLGGAAGLKLANIVFHNTNHPNHRLISAVGIFITNMFFLLYTHFAYHELAEEVSHVLMKDLENQPARLLDKKYHESSASILGVKDNRR